MAQPTDYAGFVGAISIAVEPADPTVPGARLEARIGPDGRWLLPAGDGWREAGSGDTYARMVLATVAVWFASRPVPDCGRAGTAPTPAPRLEVGGA